ncbi:MAG: FkbM family methyltransferase [Actinomycetota bacterium]|nr:FkbM family methyltransferase [Actinomycetota bacterium]
MATDFEARLADFCQTILVPGDVVVDVGAHLGRHTIPFARGVGPSGKVIAFEPIPHINQQLQSILREQAAARPMAPVRLCDVALGPTRQETTFVVVPDSPEYSGLQERTYDQGEDVERHRIPIQVEVLDDLLDGEARIDLVKIDTEGGEYGVLCGATRTLDERRPVVTFECGDNSLLHYDHTAGDLFDLLTGHGYRIENINRQPLDRSTFVESSRVQLVWD